MMIRILICIFACFSLTCFAQRDAVDDGGEIQKLPASKVAKTISLNPEYCLFGKDHIDDDAALPLLIYLHGGGGVGTDVNKPRRQVKPLLDGLKRVGIKALIVAPQATKSPKRDGGKGGWVAADLNILLAHLKETLPVNADRVYLTGNSMGGYGSFMWAGYHPEHFAAVAPMVGGIGPLGPKDITKDLAVWGKNLAGLPLRAYYGGQDRVVPADRGEMVQKAIKAAGGTTSEVIVLADQGHGAGRVPYGDPKFYTWLFSHKRSK